MAEVTSVEDLNALDAAGFAGVIGPLFERAPTFVTRLGEARPFESQDDLFDAARMIAREIPEAAQIELLDAHPRIGADPTLVSDLSRGEQGDGHVSQAWVGDELIALNEAYESRFGFRFVVFVAGRPRVDIIPLLERSLRADRDEELRRALDDIVLIARDRMATLRGPHALPEELREVIALETSRWMIGESDRDGLIRAAHRLIEEGVESRPLLTLSLASQTEESDLAPIVARLMGEIGLEEWDAAQAGQLLGLHAAASIVGGVSQPIDGARRIASVSDNPEFRELVLRWDSVVDGREGLDAEIRHAAVELFGEEE